MSRKIGRNVALNLALQAATLLLPLATTPYLARVLGTGGIGAYSYTNSIVQYFVLFGTVGLTLYGTRQIAYARDDRARLSETFWSILFLRLIAAGVALALYLGAVALFPAEFRTLLYLQALVLLYNMLDVSWLYMGLEDFQKTVARSIAAKLLGVALVFLFVKTREDTWIYVAIQAVTVLLGNLSLWGFLPKTVSWKRPAFASILHHLRPAIVLFLPQVAIELYVVFDKTMIGLLTGSVDQVGLYAKAQEFAKVPLWLIGAVSAVMLPHMSNLYERREHGQIAAQLERNLKLAACFGMVASFGVAGIAREFIPWMLGPEFQHAVELMAILSSLSFVIGVSNVVGRQYLIPANQMRFFTASVVCGAGLNFLLNLLLIPRFGAAGACVATVAAECAVTGVQLYAARTVVCFGGLWRSLVKYLAAGGAMLAAVRFLGGRMGPAVLTTAVQMIAGVAIYCILLFLLRDDLFMGGLKALRRKLHPRKEENT